MVAVYFPSLNSIHMKRVLVTYIHEAPMNGAFKVTCTSTNICNLVAIKNSVKLPECLANVYSTIASICY